VKQEIFGAIELGGTKTVCAVGTATGELQAIERIPTSGPEETISKAVTSILAMADDPGRLVGLGVGTFGPVNVERRSSAYGRILNTPKPGWRGVDILSEISRYTKLPVAVNTDVNCALMGEWTWGAGKGFTDLVYLTVGTGIGGGILCHGRLTGGSTHPEVGHMFIPAADCDREFAGVCPHHGARCAEGLASGPALALRWGSTFESLDAGHRAWELEARYLAVLCLNLFLSFSPRRIVLGGGVMQQAHLFEKIRRNMSEFLNNFIDLAPWGESLEDLIVPVALDGKAGVLGAIVLADSVLHE